MAVCGTHGALTTGVIAVFPNDFVISLHLQEAIVHGPGKGLVVFGQQVAHSVIVIIDGLGIVTYRCEPVGLGLIAVAGGLLACDGGCAVAHRVVEVTQLAVFASGMGEAAQVIIGKVLGGQRVNPIGDGFDIACGVVAVGASTIICAPVLTFGDKRVDKKEMISFMGGVFSSDKL